MIMVVAVVMIVVMMTLAGEKHREQEH